MTQPSGKTRYEIIVDSSQGVAAYKRLRDAILAMGGDIRTAKKDTDQLGTGFAGFAISAKTQLAGLVGQFMSVREIVRQLRAEFEFWQAKSAAALSATTSYAAAANRAAMMTHPAKQIDRAFMEGAVARTAPYTGITDEQAMIALQRMSSAITDVDRIRREDLEAALRLAGRSATLMGQPETTGRLGSAVLETMKRLPRESVEDALGRMIRITSEARVEEFADVAETFPQALTTGQLYGLKPSETMALYSLFGNLGVDVTGHKTSTAVAQFMRNYFGAKPFVRKQEVTKWKSIGGLPYPTRETEWQEYALPWAIDEEGREKKELNWWLNIVDRFRQEGAFDQLSDRFPGVFPTGNAVGEWLGSFRTGGAAIRYGQRYAASANPEQIEQFSQIHARGNMWPIIHGMLLSRKQEWTNMFEEAEKSFAAMEGGGFAEFGRQWMRESEQKGGTPLITQAMGKAAVDRVARKNVRGTYQAMVDQMVRELAPVLPTSTQLGTTWENFATSLRVADDQDLQGVLLERLRRERDALDDPKRKPWWSRYLQWSAATLPGFGGVAGYLGAGRVLPRAGADYNPQAAAALDELIGGVGQMDFSEDVVRRTETRLRARGRPTDRDSVLAALREEYLATEGEDSERMFRAAQWLRGQPAGEAAPNAPSTATPPGGENEAAGWRKLWRKLTGTDGEPHASSAGSRQFLLIDAAARPWYPGTRPMQGGIGAS